jgi:hypothetical protein
MKKIPLIILLLCLSKAYAQRLIGHDASTQPIATNGAPRMADNTKIHLVDSIQVIDADVLPYKSDPKVKNDRYYFWVLDNVIRSTQGGFSGTLLNGHYVAYYPNKNLKEEGGFDRGLKEGVWKTWDRKGALTNVTNWDEGIIVPDSGQPFWKKPFSKKSDQQQASGTPPAANQ